MRGNEFADDFRPRFNHLCFVQTLAQSEPLHQLREQIGWRLPPFWPHFPLGKTAPFGDYGSAKRGFHHNYLATDRHGWNTDFKIEKVMARRRSRPPNLRLTPPARPSQIRFNSSPL
jgi:hypothetical protein